jgi:predicted Zn-dependent protease
MADILSAITLEKAQIGIDLKDMQATKTWIPLLPGTIQGKILTAEAYILFGQVENSREIANQMLDRVKDNSLLEARIHTILGRGYEAQMNIDKAHEHFLLALIKLEEQDDIWGLSRVQSNLGAILLKMRSLDDAQTLLSSAQDIQFLIGDRVGLAITQHNLRLLQVALSS